MANRPPHPPDRTERGLPWFRRRGLLLAAGTWGALGGWAIAASDRIETGPDSTLTLVVGDSAFHIRQASQVALQGESPGAVRVLRVLTGAVAAVWGKGTDRQVILPTATAGIRGTGIYAEVLADQDNRGYFCNCYGTIELQAGTERLLSESVYHQSFWAESAPRGGRLLTPSPAINHTDEELEFLAGLVRQPTAWQIAGRRGTRDGRGQMEPYGGSPQTPAATPATPEPAAPPAPPAPLNPAPARPPAADPDPGARY